MKAIDLMASFAPYYYICKPFAVFPVSRVKNEKKELSFQNSIISRIYSLVLYFIFFVPTSVLVTYKIIQELEHYKEKRVHMLVNTFLLLVDTCPVLIASFGTFVFIVYGSRKVPSIFSRMAHADKVLEYRLSGHVKARRLLVGKAVLVFSVLVVLFVDLMVYKLVHMKHVNLWVVLGVNCYFALHVLNVVLDMQFVGVVSLLKGRFGHLNKEVRKLQGYKEPDRPEPRPNSVHPDGWNERMKLPPLTAARVQNVQPPCDFRERVKSLRTIHFELCDVVEDMNVAYGFTMLAHFCDILFSVMYCSYHFIIHVTDLFAFPSHQILFNMLEVTVVSVRTIIITWICYATSEEANNTRNVVQKLTVETDMKSENASELRQFSSQLLHRRKVKLMACGVFQIDLALLRSIATSVMMYLVVLIQFDIQAKHHVLIGDTPHGDSTTESSAVTTSIPIE